MSKSIIDRINYIVALITEFATAHHITTQQAYQYLQQYKGLDFVEKFYDVEHTFSFENTVEDLTLYCKRMAYIYDILEQELIANNRIANVGQLI